MKALRQGPPLQSHPESKKRNRSPRQHHRAPRAARLPTLRPQTSLHPTQQNPDPLPAAYAPRRRRRPDLRLHRRRPHFRHRQRSRRLLQLPHPRRTPRHARLRLFLAPPPLLSRQHPSHPRSRSLVQIQFHAKNERQKILRNPRLPPTNQAPPRTLQTLVAQALLPVTAEAAPRLARDRQQSAYFGADIPWTRLKDDTLDHFQSSGCFTNPAPTGLCSI